MNIEQLKKVIEDSFPFVEKPNGIAMSFHKDDCDQCRYLREEMESYDMKELPAEAIRYLHQEMSCLSAQGWRWALPSYLRYCITKNAEYTQMETEFLIYNLAPKQKFQQDTKMRLSELSDTQINCLASFLEWCKVHEFWGSYCPKEISQGITFLSTIRRA